jgi:hypothetical protein
MASTRTTTQKRRVSRTTSSRTPKQALTAVARHAVHIQIAAGATAVTTLAQWAQTTDRFAQSVADELLRRLDGETDAAELVARVTTASSVHLRELSALPRAAANHFDTRLARASTNHKEVR